MAERDRKPDRIARRFNSKRHCRWVVNPAIPKSLQTRQEVYILKSYVKWHQQAIHTRAFILINLILWKMVIEKITFVSKKTNKREFASLRVWLVWVWHFVCQWVINPVSKLRDMLPSLNIITISISFWTCFRRAQIFKQIVLLC